MPPVGASSHAREERIQSAILLLLIPLALLGSTLLWGISSGFAAGPGTAAVGFSCAALLLFSYGLLRVGWSSPSRWILAGTVLVGPLAAGTATPSLIPWILPFTVVSLWVIGFLTTPAATGLATLLVSALMFLPWPGTDLVSRALLSTLILMAGGLVAVSSLIRRQNEVEIGQQHDRLKAQRDELAESQARLQEAQRLAKVGSWTWREGQEPHWSKGMAAMLGRPEGFEPTKEAFWEHIPAEVQDRVRQELTEAANADEPTMLELPMVTRDGAGLHTLWRIRRLSDQSEAQHLVGVVQDITERKQVEDQERLRLQAEARYEELKQMTQLTSHEFREPIRTIRSFLQLLEREASAELSPSAKEYIGFAQDGAGRLRNLIRDFTRYTEASGQAPAMRSVDLRLSLRGAQRRLSAFLEETGAVVTNGPLPMVLGDSQQLTLVLEELIENAIVHNDDQGARVHIEAEPVEGMWRLAVHDDGPGIPESYQDQVFEVFETLEGPDPERGTGLGLALVRRIVEVHGGRIWVERRSVQQGATQRAGPAWLSEPGTTVFIELPPDPDHAPDLVGLQPEDTQVAQRTPPARSEA